VKYSIFGLDLNTIMLTSSLINVNVTQQWTTIAGAAIKNHNLIHCASSQGITAS
jgi:hypothetical protein